MEEKLEKRVLTIDDEDGRILASNMLFRNLSRNVYVQLGNLNRQPYFNNDGSLNELGEEKIKSLDRKGYSTETFGSENTIGHEIAIIEALNQEPYRLILLDGNLGMRLEGEHFDGKVVVRKLRNGEYGILNKDTPILCTSSVMHAIPQELIDGSWSLDYVLRMSPEERVDEAKCLLGEYQ